MPNFTRKRLRHGMPDWVRDGEIYFITMNCKTRGVNSLAKDHTAIAVHGAIQYYIRLGKWWPRLVVIMPDHLHTLVSLNTARHTIPQILSPWKSYLRKTQGIEWQEGFFEHRIRNEDSLTEKAHYLLQNPVRAKLVKSPDDWPYLWNQSNFEPR